MSKRILGKDLEVSAVGLGCLGLTHAYGTAMDENEAARVIARAVEMGYTFFDTAECYTGTRVDGVTSYNEDAVGRALKSCRHQVKLATKFGMYQGEDGRLHEDSRPETIRAAIEGSLKRLQTDYIDLYYQHRVDPNVPAEEVAGLMADLMQEGKILH